LSGLFFTNCPYPGIGKRWAEAEHISEIWYQTFHQQEWITELLGRDRRNCEIYLSAMLTHWAHDPHAFDDHLAHWVDNFMAPGNLQGGCNWYIAQHESRMALVRDGAPCLPIIDVPTRLLWGGRDPVILSEWADRLGDYFSDFQCEVHDEAGHFVHFEQAADTNRAITDFFSSAKVAARN
jgi:pimeloyl-ACP methyl ester carboxylesterase